MNYVQQYEAYIASWCELNYAECSHGESKYSTARSGQNSHQIPGVWNQLNGMLEWNGGME